MIHFNFKRLITGVALTLLCGLTGYSAEVPEGYLQITPYSQNFQTNPVSSSKFNPPLGWSNYSDGTSVSYTSASFNGGYGIGVSTDQMATNRYNMIVTPKISGDLTFKTRRYAYSDYYKFYLEFYRMTLKEDGTFTFDPEQDRIPWDSPYAEDATGTDWSDDTYKITVGADYTYVGIRMSYAYIGDITASSALIPIDKGLKIESVSLLPGYTDKVAADDDGKFNLGFKVTLTNTGNVELSKASEGDRWNYNLAYYTSSYGNPYTCDLISKGELPTLPADGEPVSFEVRAKVDAPETAELQSDGSLRVRVDFIENFSTKEIDQRYKTAGWFNLMSNKGVMELRYDKKTSRTNKETTTVDPSAPMYAGAFKGTRSLPFKMRNRGVGDIVIQSIDAPDWITFEGMETGTTVGNNEEKEFNIIIGGAAGYKEGKVKFNFDGISIVNEINLAADVIGADEYLADFEEGGLDEWYQPAGSPTPAWSITEYNNDERKAKVNVAEYNFNDNKLENGNRSKPGYAIYSPKLQFEEGDLLSFWAAKRYNSGDDVFLKVMYSPDRASWTELGTITVNNEDESLRFYCSNPAKPTSDGKDVMKHFSFVMPEGSYYISLTAGYVTVDNFHGGKMETIAYDLISEAASAGKTRVVNNPLTFTAAFTNLSSSDVAAEGQTVTLFANGEKVAVSEPQEIKGREAVDYNFIYTPHTSGQTELYAQIVIGDYTVNSPKVTVSVSEESAESVTFVGNVTKFENFGPVYPSYENSKSEFVYTAEDLGLQKGAKITKISYPYYKTEVDHSALGLTIWMENTDDEKVGDTLKDPEDMTVVFSSKRYLYPKAGSEADPLELTFTLDEPFIYDGTNLRIIMESKGVDPKWGRCNFGLDYSDNSRLMRYFYKDDETQYEDGKCGAGSTAKAIPVVNIYTEKGILTVSGTVSNEEGEGIANATVTATAKDSEVYYTANTDEEGAWSITLYQTDLEYMLTAAAEGYVTSEPAELKLDESNDIVLETLIYGPAPITVRVSAVTEVSTKGLVVTLTGEESGFVFDPLKVTDEGSVTFTYVPSGVYTLTVDGSPLGLEKYVDRNLGHNGEQTVSVVLEEAVRNPYALNATLEHDEFTGENTAILTWNRETDYYFDDFESYEPFAIEFSPWTGHDLDKEPAVEIVGLYPNRGIPQYATIFNPLTIDPPVYYEYEVLRPYSGKQCVGFVRTRSGNANNDWLISPKVKVGVNNVVSFMAKASETQPDRFAVCVSNKGTDAADFKQLTPGNYETVDYKGWKEITYSLAEYEGQEVYVAIHCMSKGSFMFMVDDFYVGPVALPKKARRVNRRSAENPNEVFTLTFDGQEAGRTEDYSFVFNNVESGKHVLGVTAEYVKARSEESLIEINVPGAEDYAALTLKLVPDVSDVSLQGQKINLMSVENGRLTIVEADKDGMAKIGFLPKGNYLVNVETEIFDDYTETIKLDGDRTLEIALKETIATPYNLTYDITHNEGDEYDVELWWNRTLGFSDSFENYEDFTQEIGDWTVLDIDKMPTYAFSLNEILVTKPETRGLVGAMVFNPYATEPVEASQDGLFIAPDGDKYVMFNSAEMAQSDDWLISPTVKIGEDYVVRFSAKSYQDMYPGTIEIHALHGKDIAKPNKLDVINFTDDWMRYEISLADFEGENIEIAFHHITYDGWLSFIDDVYVGPREDSNVENPASKRCTFDVYLSDKKVANVSEPYHKFSSLKEGTYKAGVQAIYPSGKKSEIAEITISVSATDGVVEIITDGADSTWQWFDVNGIKVNSDNLNPGIYIRTNGTKAEKVIIR